MSKVEAAIGVDSVLPKGSDDIFVPTGKPGVDSATAQAQVRKDKLRETHMHIQVSKGPQKSPKKTKNTCSREGDACDATLFAECALAVGRSSGSHLELHACRAKAATLTGRTAHDFPWGILNVRLMPDNEIFGQSKTLNGDDV